MKKRHKKLTIHRETLRRLESSHLKVVVGGTADTAADCDTVIPTKDSICSCTGDTFDTQNCDFSGNPNCVKTE